MFYETLIIHCSLHFKSERSIAEPGGKIEIGSPVTETRRQTESLIGLMNRATAIEDLTSKVISISFPD